MTSLSFLPERSILAFLCAGLLSGCAFFTVSYEEREAVASCSAAQVADREIWLEKMQMVCENVLRHQAEGTLNASLPKDPRQKDKNGQLKENPKSASFEAFARTLVGIAAWLELPDTEDYEGRLRKQYRAWAVKGIINAVGESKEEQLHFYPSSQSLVECAYLVQSFWLAPKSLWEPLPEGVKAKICENFLLNVHKPARTNWLFFGTLPHLFVLEQGSAEQQAKVDKERVLQAPRSFMEEFYKGDGWYGDGQNYAYDYYNSYVIHPMLYETLVHLKNLPPEKKDFLKIGDSDINGWLAKEKPRFKRHAEFLERSIMPDGTYPQQGRSAQYRFGCFQLLSYACYLDSRGENLRPRSHGQIRAGLTEVLKRQCVAENFDSNGWMHIGFNGSQPWAAENYCTPGSVYLCSAIFHVLGLPPGALFWTAPREDWTQKKIWSGQKYPIDRALK